MDGFEWIASTAFAALLCWSIARAFAHRHLTIDEATLSAFKLMLRHRDIGNNEIPDAALVDIIAEQTAEVMRKAASNGKPSRWQRYLIRQLDSEADLIEMVLRCGPQQYAGHHSFQVLLKYGVVEPIYPPPMSVEQFSDAARRGTLYAELDERML